LDITLFDQWPSYVNELRENAGLQNFIIYKYFQALRHLHDEDPVYFETLAYEPGSGYVVPPGGYTEEERFLRFQALVRGFSLHLSVMAPGSEQLAAAIDRFQEAVNNPKLVATLFGVVVSEGRASDM
jgi:hypothetical protein